MPAAATDYYQKVGRSTATTLSAPGYTIGNTSINVGSTTNWPTTTGITFAIDTIDSNGVRVAGTYNTFRGTVNTATQITNVTYVGGDANQNYSAGSTTRVYILAQSDWANRLVDGIIVHADQDGTLKAGAVDETAVLADSVVTSAKISNDTITNDDMATAVKPETNFGETTFDYVASGCVITGDSYGTNLKWSMTAGVVYIGGRRVVVGALSAQDVVASKDTYIDVSNAGTVTFTGGNSVANNAASPALAASSIRLGIIQSGANIASVAAVNQGQETKVLPIASSIPYQVTDSLGNLICPRDPQRKILGYRQISSTFSTATTGSMVDVTGISCPFITPGNRKVKTTFFGAGIDSSHAAGSVLTMAIRESTTTLADTTNQTPVTQYRTPSFVTLTNTPSAGLHTYLGSIFQSGTGTMNLRASSTGVIFIQVELA